MRSNALEPRRERCPRCGAPVVRLVLAGGLEVLVEPRELGLDAVEAHVGLVVAVDTHGNARPMRLPTAKRHHGEAVHTVHEVTCRYAGLPVHEDERMPEGAAALIGEDVVELHDVAPVSRLDDLVDPEEED